MFAGWLGRISLAQAVVDHALADLGMDPARVTVADIGPDGIVLSGVRIGDSAGPGVTTGRVVVRPNGFGLPHIEIANLDLRAAIIDGRPDLGPLNALLAGDAQSGEAGVPVLPDTVIRGLRISVSRDALTAQVELPGAVNLRGGIVTANSAIIFSGTGISGDGQARSRTDMDGRTAFTLALDTLEIGTPWLPRPLRLDGSALEADIQPDFLATDVKLRLSDGRGEVDLSLVAAAPFARPAVEASLAVRAGNPGGWRDLLPELPGDDGTFDLRLVLLATLDADALRSSNGRDPGSSTASGHLELDARIDGLPWAQSVRAGMATGLELRTGVLDLDRVAFDVDVSGIDRRLVPESLRTGGSTPVIAGTARLDLDPGARGSINITGQSAEFTGRLGFESIARGTLDVRKAWASTDLQTVEAEARLTLPGAQEAGVTLRQIEAVLPLLLQNAGTGLDVRIVEGRVTAGEARLDGVLSSTGPVRVDLPLLTVRNATDNPAIAVQARLAPFAGTLHALDTVLDVGGGDLQLTNRDGTSEVRAELRDLGIDGYGRLARVSGSGPFDLAARTARLEWALDGLAPDPRRGLPAVLATVNGVLGLEGERLSLTGDAGLMGQAGLSVSMEGGQQLAQGIGQASVVLKPLNLADLDAALQDLAGGTLSGIVAGQAGATWGDGTNASAELRLDNVGVATKDIAVEGVNGELVLASLTPPRTRGAQAFTIRRIFAGADITDVRMELRVISEEDRTGVAVDSLTGSFLGGGFAVRPVVLFAGEDSRDMVLDLMGLDLRELARLIDVEGVELEGRVSGAVPVHLEGEDGIAASDVTLTSDGPGIIRIAGSIARDAIGGSAGEQVDLVLQTLEDFRFDSLLLHMDKALDGEAEMRVTLAGANPAVLDGHPFKFNVNVSGNADRLFQTILTVYEASSGAIDRTVKALR